MFEENENEASQDGECLSDQQNGEFINNFYHFDYLAYYCLC